MTEAPARFMLFGLLAGALFTGIVAVLGAGFVWENGAHYAFLHALGQGPRRPVSRGRRRPIWNGRRGSSTLAIPLGSALMCFRFLQVAWSFARTGELPHHDHGHVEGIEVDGRVPSARPCSAPATAGATGRRKP